MDKEVAKKRLADTNIKIKQLESALYQLIGQKTLLQEFVDEYEGKGKNKEEK